MSNAVSPAVVNAATGTIDQVKNGALTSVKWLYRQVITIKDFVFATVAKIAAYVKPVFAKLAKVGCDGFSRSKEFLVANKEIAGLVAIGGIIGVFLGVYGTQSSNKESATT